MSLLAALDSIADAPPEQHAAAWRVLDAAAPDLLSYVFGKPHTSGEHDRMLNAQSVARRTGATARVHVADPAVAADTGDIGPFRAQVCDWGRGHGWPRADSRQPLDSDMLAAYRAAQGGERGDRG